VVRLLVIPGLLVIAFTLWDAFETMILPRRVSRRIKFTRWFYKYSWQPYAALCRKIQRAELRESILSFYGPASFLILLALWAILLVVGFAFLYRAEGFTVDGSLRAARFGTDLYFSGTTFFTLGLGDVSSRGAIGRTLTVVEAGTGFGFLALVIGYLPVLYQAFSRREVHISLLDARAGSPPTAMGLLTRYDPASRSRDLDELMEGWERWAAELLESHLSYPQLGYFRSQHDRQSWVAALCCILDANAVLIALAGDATARPFQLAFAMARHTAVDLGHTFGRAALKDTHDRLPPEAMKRMRAELGSAWPDGAAGDAAELRLTALRVGYEQDIGRIAERLLMPLPPWFPEPGLQDDWETGL
jgi:Ion channel